MRAKFGAPKIRSASARQRVHKSPAHVSKSHTLPRDSIRVSNRAMQQSMGLRHVGSGHARVYPRLMRAEFGAPKSGVLQPDSACTCPEPTCRSPILCCMARFDTRIESHGRVWDLDTCAGDLCTHCLAEALRILGPRILHAVVVGTPAHVPGQLV